MQPLLPEECGGAGGIKTADPLLTVPIGVELPRVLLAILIVAVAFMIGVTLLMTMRNLLAITEYSRHYMLQAEPEPSEGTWGR